MFSYTDSGTCHLHKDELLICCGSILIINDYRKTEVKVLMKKLIANIWWISWSILLVAQIVLCILFYNWADMKALTYIGYAVIVVGFIIGSKGVNTLKEKGKAPKGKSWIETTTLVDSGIYGTVRHPQYLSWILISIAMMFISQYWVVIIVGIAASVTIYMQARQDDQQQTEKFGEEYRRYMERVPRMNPLTGVIRMIRR